MIASWVLQVAGKTVASGTVNAAQPADAHQAYDVAAQVGNAIEHQLLDLIAPPPEADDKTLPLPLEVMA